MLGDVIEVHHPDRLEALRLPLAGGDRGVADTVETMRALVRDSHARGMSAGVARRLIAGLRGRVARLHAIFRWMQQHIDFCEDPKGVERIRHPDLILREIGDSMRSRADRPCVDCDESAPVAAALLLGAGFRPVFITISEPGDTKFSHVYAGVVAAAPAHVIAFDPQEMAHVGQEPKYGRRAVWPILD